jgi:ADP-dependent NAD(P)H-hydrate dehydratase / NAD(P)H-hydrate epimerase
VGASIILKGSRVEQIDAECVENGIDSKQLMGNAGRRVAETIIKDIKDSFLPNKRIAGKVKGVVVCGGGNNGGDGFAAAAILAGENVGAEIDVFCITGDEKFSADSKYYFNALSNNSNNSSNSNNNGNVKTHFLNIEDISAGQDFISKLKIADFVVDAIFGTGIRGREIHGQAKAVIECINSAKSLRTGIGNPEPISFPGEVSEIISPSESLYDPGANSKVAGQIGPENISSPGRPDGPLIPDPGNRANAFIYSIDIPSGIDSDTGQVLGTAVKADKTITFGCKKLGIAIYPGRDFAGEVIIADIGIPLKYYQSYEKIYEADLAWVAEKMPQRQSSIYKHAVGKLLVIAGSLGFTGAASMVCEAAMRAGAGIVTLVCPWELNSILEIKLTETMTYPVAQTDDLSIDMDAFEEIMELSEKFDALAIGPGLSQNPSTICLVREVLKQFNKPTVLDADGLRALYGPMEIGIVSNFKMPNVIITPHSGEMAAILGKNRILPEERFSCNLEAVRRFGAVSVLKGAATIITDSEMVSFINPTGSWALATAGTGDILTGIIGSLLAQGVTLAESAVCGAFIHGMASDIMSESTGKTSQIASDLLEGIKKVFLRIEKIKY